VEDSDEALFTRHTFFVFFGGNEVGEALAGVFLIFVFLSPLALLISFAFLCLVQATFSFLYWGYGFLHTLAPSSFTR
jgi:hypothetical protein